MTDKRQKTFKFDGILDETVSQEDVYESIEMERLLSRVIEGYHSTIFAYGQTGSGKTYTIEGGNKIENMGLIPRSIHNIYRLINAQSERDPEVAYKISLSYLQIYNEQIYDLIDNASQAPLKMRWNKHQQFVVESLFEPQCRSVTEAVEWWRKGQRNKIVDSHNMNSESSRSHCILTIKVKSYEVEDPSNYTESKLEIVDLAGSERQKVTKSTGIVFREGIQINKSLFALRQVINSLYESNVSPTKQNLPPYRDSKLTCLLKQSIGGNAYCVMIACLNPTLSHFEQSLQTLTYASMATYITSKPQKNIDPKLRENKLLAEQNYNLKEDIRKLSLHIEYLTSLLEKNRCEKCGGEIKLRRSNTTEEGEIFKLPKFNTASNKKARLSPTKQTVNMSSSHQEDGGAFESDQSGSLFKKRRAENSITEGVTSKSQKPYQMKNPKEVLESITMIKDLINTNSKLRDKIEAMRDQGEKMEREMFQINQENQLLRDRWEMVSSNLKAQQSALKSEHSEAPISLYERLLKEQSGEALVQFESSASNKLPISNHRTQSVHREQQVMLNEKQMQRYEPYRPYNQMLKKGVRRNKDLSVHRRNRMKTTDTNRSKKYEPYAF